MKTRGNEEQIIEMLREAETTGNHRDGCRKDGLSEQTFYPWRRRAQGLRVSARHRLQLREAENAKRKRLVAEPALALQPVQELRKKKGRLCASVARWGRS
jgi:putative transposase